jgi:hypothetical protein
LAGSTRIRSSVIAAPLLEIASATKAFGGVRALKDAWFNLRAVPPGQPGGLPDISRGLSAATPPVAVRKRSRTPKGCQNFAFHSPNHPPESLAPLRGAGHLFVGLPGVSSRSAFLNPRLISGSPSGCAAHDVERRCEGQRLIARHHTSIGKSQSYLPNDGTGWNTI